MRKSIIRQGLVAIILALMFGGAAQAQNAPVGFDANDDKSQVCTTFAERAAKIDAQDNANPADGLLTSIYKFIKETVVGSPGNPDGGVMKKLFQAFTKSKVYQQAVFAAMSLAIAFYGIGFVVGVVQLSAQQTLSRIIKIAVISALISPQGWDFFNDTVVAFFADGTDDLIAGIMSISFPVNAPPGAGPFYQLDKLATFVLTPDTIIGLMGTLASGPFGMGMSVLLGMAVWAFLSLIITALRTYAVSYVARALILGVAPIFFVFLLFDKTKQSFVSWVNALVNLSLRPILLFTFISFFVVMMNSAAKDMLHSELCWVEGASLSGTTNKVAFWRYVDPKHPEKGPIVGDMTWKGSLDCILTGKGDCPEFPINVVDVLSFLILMYIAQRFASVTDRIATDLSNALVALDTGGRLEQFIQERSQSGSNNPLGLGARNASGATRRPGTGR